MQKCIFILNHITSIQARKEKESELIKQIDERAFQLTLELAKGKKGREEIEERYSSELNDLLDKVES
jgi:hypothetical protein